MDKQEFIQKMKDQPFSVLSDLVYQYIVDAIVEIRFPPGSKSIPRAYQKNWASVGLPYALLWSVLWSKNWWSR